MRLLITLIIILISGCNYFENEQVVSESYIGEWQWEESVGGIGGWTIHSDSVDFSESITINQSNELFWYRDGELIQKYAISDVSEDMDGELLLRPVLEGSSMEKVINGFQNGRLVIGDTCYDCYIYYFKR